MNLHSLHGSTRDEKIEWAKSASLADAMAYSDYLLTDTIYQTNKTHSVVGVVGMYSGGNDSTTFIHMLRHRLTHAAHVNTGIGVRETREFVRDTCRGMHLPLIEVTPSKGREYQDLVAKWGFPGPNGHGIMYNRLKDRGFGKIRAQFVENPREQRVVFAAGMRCFESARRMRNTTETSRTGSIQWCSPIAYWTNDHMSEYRETYDVPRNEVSDHLHMSGECLCGAYAKVGELGQLRFFYPEAAEEIDRVQKIAKAAKVHCVWGTPPPKKPPYAGDTPTWVCFHDLQSHRDDPNSCDDGTWWRDLKSMPTPPVGEFCVKCEVGVVGLDQEYSK